MVARQGPLAPMARWLFERDRPDWPLQPFGKESLNAHLLCFLAAARGPSPAAGLASQGDCHPSVRELLPRVVAAVAPLLVLAAGGIGDGAGVARALRAGAQGVSLGTRFVASDEAWAHPEHKRRIVASTAADTVYGELFDVWWPGAPHRVLRTRLVAEWEAAGRPPPGQRPGEGTPIGTLVRSSGERIDWPRYAVGVAGPDFDGDIEDAPLWAGES